MSYSVLDTLSDMRVKGMERMEKMTPLVIAEFPDPQTFSERIVLGSFSWSMQKSKKRLIVKSGLMNLWSDIPQTAPEIARDYLDLRYPRQLRINAEQKEYFMAQDWDAPLYYEPMLETDGVYLDLRSAYWSIMGAVGVDVDYMPGKWLSPGRAPHDYPTTDKLARNCIVTAGLLGTMQVWTGSKFITQTPYNKHANLSLFTLIQHILHGIASDAVTMGACYVNTDGYIMPYYKSEMFIRWVNERWGLPIREKYRGLTHVTGVGSYKVGNHTSGRFSPTFTPPYSNLKQPPGVNMLKCTFRMIASDRVDKPYRFER